MDSHAQSHYYDSNNVDVITPSNGGDFITILLICSIIAVVCAFPGGLVNNSLNKPK